MCSMIDREREMRSPVATVLGTLLLAAYPLDFNNLLFIYLLLRQWLVRSCTSHLEMDLRQKMRLPLLHTFCAHVSWLRVI